MPMYAFRCTECGHKESFLLPIKGRHACPNCPKCGTHKTMERDVSAEGGASTNKQYDNPIYSESMGVAPDQVGERRAKFPDIPHTDDGRVIINSLADQNRITKQLGFADKN